MRRQSSRIVALVGGLSILLPVTPVHASRGVNKAAGVVTLKGSTTAVVPLEVAEDARLSLDYYDESSLTGPRFSDGPGLAAVILVPDTDSGPTRPLTAVRLPEAPGQIQRLTSFGPNNCMVTGPDCAVRAGSYRMFLVTESPVTVTLRFQGLSGSTTLRAREAVEGAIVEPGLAYSYGLPYMGTGLDAVGAGFAPQTTGTAIVFSAFWFRGAEQGIGPAPADEPLLQVGVAGACSYFEEPPAVGAYSPGCPRGSEVGTFATQRVLDDFAFMQWNQLAGAPPGTYGLGNYAIHTGIFDPGFVGFWIDGGSSEPD
jgi:hypothetical protein